MSEPTGVRSTVPVSDSPIGSAQPDFACAYEVDIPQGDTRSAEQWARDIWEGAPATLRWFMVAGWRLVLRLRLGPSHSPDHILGWRIEDRSATGVLCRLDSPFLGADNTFRQAGGKLVWSTFVSYRSPVARVVWPPASVIHRVLVRLALRRAAGAVTEG